MARRLLGTARAFEWLTTGRRLSAEDARAMGIVSEVVPEAEFAERMLEVAAYFASLPTRAVWQTKRLLDAAETTTFAQQLELEANTQAELTRTHDFTEGVAAFLAKREAEFTGEPLETHPVNLVLHGDLQRWRLTVAFRLLLALPHLAVLTLWMYLVVPVALVNWLITLVRGRTPAGVHNWLARYLRYWLHVQAYVNLVADPYPGFRGWPGTYPVDLEIAPPQPQPRWKTLLRIVLVIPAYVLGYVLSVVQLVVFVIAWVAALALGRIPRGLRDLLAYCLRYQAQVNAYVLLLTSRYPTLASGTGFQFEEG
jgi:hypothetical protein